MAYYENINEAQQRFQQAVQRGEMQQWEAEQELKSIRAHNMQKAQQNLNWQVQQGWINKDQASQAMDQLGQMDDNQFAQATAVDPAAGGQDSIGSYTNKNPNYYTTDPNSGAAISPITGTHQAGWGAPVAPATNFDTASNAVSSQEAMNRYNLEQQLLTNRPNEQTAYGSATWSRDPVTGEMTRTTKLSDAQQQILDQQQGRDYQLGQGAGNALNQFGAKGEFSYSGAPKISGSEDLLGERKRQEDLYYQNFLARNEKDFSQQQESLKQSLADRGIPLTSERAQQEMRQLNQQQSDAKLNAQATAIEKSGSEYDRNFNTQLQNRNQYINEYGQERYAPLNEMGTMLGMQKGITDPNVSGIAQMNVLPTDVAGIGTTYRGQDINQQIEQYKRENEQWLGKLDADTRVKVANIGAEAAKYGAKLGLEGTKYRTDTEGDNGTGVKVGEDNLNMMNRNLSYSTYDPYAMTTQQYNANSFGNPLEVQRKRNQQGTFGTNGNGYFGV